MARIPGKNMTAKILSVILASILWIYVVNEQNPPVDYTFTVPLEVRNVTEGLTMVDNPDAVRMKVRGPRSIVAGALPKDLKPYIDAKGLREGRHTLLVYAQAPSSLEIIEVIPDKITVRIDAALQRQMPVEIRTSGAVAAGPLVPKVNSSTSNVAVSGPRSIVETVDRIVASIDLNGKSEGYSTTIPVAAVNRDGKEVEGITVNPSKIKITLSFVPGPNKKIVDIKPTVFGDLALGVSLKRITTEPEKMEISGDPEVLQRTEFIYTEPINLTGIGQDTVKETKLLLREGIVAAQNPVTVRIAVDNSR